MKIIDVPQRSPEWFEARLGVPTSSNFDKIITMAGKPSTQSKNYMYKLAGEKVSNHIEDSYQNAAMLRGIELEDEARQLYQIVSGNEVEQVGFCITERDSVFGASPDGVVGDDGLIEIKCPLVHTHVKYLIDNKLPSEYFQQIQGQMLVTGRKWCDFVSYFPGIKPLIIKVERDEDFLKLLKVELTMFCGKLNMTIKQLKEK